MQLEQTRGDGAGNGGGQRRGDPDADIADDVAHLQHTGADALGHQTAPAVLPKAHDGESYHLGAAARLGGQNRHKEHGQRAARSAQNIGGKAHGDEGEQHQRRGLQSLTDGHGHGRAHHQRAETADGVIEGHVTLLDGQKCVSQKADAELLADGVQNGAHQQRAEQALRHGGHGVDKIALGGEGDVLPRQKCPDFFHSMYLIIPKNLME